MNVQEILGAAEAFTNAEHAVNYVAQLYEASANEIQEAFSKFAGGTPSSTLEGATYPAVAVQIGPDNLAPTTSAHFSYGVLSDPGLYMTTLTRPDIFRDYYIDQFQQIINNHHVPIWIGKSAHKIPLPYVTEFVTDHLDPEHVWRLKFDFVLPDLTRINDDISNGVFVPRRGEAMPLALFPAERVDFSLHRLMHYTGTNPHHFQGFVLLTNYQYYVDEFIAYSKKQLEQESGYSYFVEPGNRRTFKKDGVLQEDGIAPDHLPQMPAYHLVRPDGQGITLVNIGVGPTNAKTITDHIAVLRPHCWIMIGHCAGFRRSQHLGDYVLAQAYMREDAVLDDDLPTWVPVPPIAEVQVALRDAIQDITRETGADLKDRTRVGTVACVCNRNWELRSQDLYRRFRQSRAIALDMESGVVAANGFRFRVPYGALLCVSDKPLHGEIKLKGMANSFYKQRVGQHLHVGIRTIELLRARGVADLHSRKLRGFDEVAFR